MDEAFAAVLAEYEVRAQAEEAADSQHRDERLLPVGPITGRFLNDLVRAMPACRALEVGTSYGYSTLWLAQGLLAVGGRLTTLELVARKSEHAREQLTRAGVAAAVSFLVGDALGLLETYAGAVRPGAHRPVEGHVHPVF
jgi:predicted O-methyltransferase YrrM